MSKERPRDFDPHPGDPWHPEWASGEEAAGREANPETDAAWWQAMRTSSTAGDSAALPEAYAALGSSPADQHDADESSVTAEPMAGTTAPPVAASDAAAIAAVARAFEGEISRQVDVAAPEETQPAITVDLRVADALQIVESQPVEPAAAPDAGAPEPDQEFAARDEPEPESVAQAVVSGGAAVASGEALAEPELVAQAVAPGEAAAEPELVAQAVASGEAAAEPELVAQAVAPGEASAEPELPGEPTPAEVEDQAATAATRAAERAAELSLVEVLTSAEQTAHEESQMWTAIADARVILQLGHLPSASNAPALERAPRGDSWAADALAMEESRQRLDESRRRTEAELRHTLAATLAQAPPTSPPAADAGAVAARFRAISAQLELEESAAEARRIRREELRLHTSLLVLEAEEPWEDRGWARPGKSLGSAARLLAPSFDGPQIGTNVGAPVAESAPRRRWPFARRRRTPAAPTGLYESRVPVSVVEEQALAGREDEAGDEGQSSLPFEDPRLARSDESAESTPPGLDDDLAAWSDLDWDLDDDEADELVPDRSRPAEVDASSADESESSPDADWEEFTAEEYVKTATRDYADLAAAVAAAETEETHQAAISAEMPGLESSLVGLEDVVTAEGMEVADAAPRSDLALRVVTGLGLVALFFASLTYRWSIGLLVIVVMVLAAGELATVLLRQGRHPVALFAYAGTLGSLIGAWAYGPVAIPFVATASIVVVAMYFGLVAGREDPATSLALTMMVVLWVGVLSAFAMDMVSATEYRWLISSLVVVVAVMDMAQYFVGKRLGKRHFAPIVSPKKTVAGLVGGIVAAVATGYGLSFIAPYDATTGVVLGAAMALTGPIGDLAVSVLKRTLSVKDMGTILPGHGGALDRIDAILFSLPAAWIVFAWAGLLV